jgi:hypothetical protein
MNMPTYRLAAGLALIACGPWLASCDDDAPRAQDKPAATEKSAPQSAAHQEKWLQPSSKITPAQWMASRTLPEVKPLHDAEVKRIAANLDAANKVYRESERMIANRAVQVEAMLKDISVNEQAADILDGLTRVAGEIGQTEGFGAVSQHYFNLRANRIDRAEALATLTSRYGVRR